MTYSIRLHTLKCIEESDESSDADEPYVLVTTVDMRPPPAIPRPVITRRYGEWTNFDEDESLELVGERPFWGAYTEPGEPEDIANPDDVCFIVTVIEHDHAPMDSYRLIAQTIATTTALQTITLQRPARVAQMIADINGAIAGPSSLPAQDNPVGTLELRLDTIDLATPAGQFRDKVLFFDGGDNGKWELTFRLVRHERRPFPAGSRLAAVSRSWDQMDLWLVGQDGLLYSNRFNGRWHGWYTLPAVQFPVGTHLAALSREAGHLEVWAVANDGKMHGIWFDGSSWRDWYELGGAAFPPGAPVAAVSRHRDLMEVWCVDIHGKVRHKYFADGVWKPEGAEWLTLGAEATFPAGAHLVAASRSPWDMQVWVVGDDKPISRNLFVNDVWTGWTPLGAEIFAPGTHLAAVVRKKWPVGSAVDTWGLPVNPYAVTPHQFVLGVDMNEHVRDFWYEEDVERGWYQAGIQSFNSGTVIAGVSHQPETVDIWAVRPDGFLYFNHGIASGWTGWNRIDTETAQIAPPAHIAAVSRFEGHMEVWAIREGFVCGNAFTNGSWQGWYPLRWSFVK